VGWGVVAALKAGEIQDRHIWMSCRELGAPHFLHAVGRVILRPDIPDIERSVRCAGFIFFLEPSRQPGFVFGGGTNRQNGITKRLKVLGQPVILTWIGVVWPSEYQEGEPVFSFDAFQYLQAAPLH